MSQEDKRYAIVGIDGRVDNLVVANPEYAEIQGWVELPEENPLDPDAYITVCIGDEWTGFRFKPSAEKLLQEARWAAEAEYELRLLPVLNLMVIDVWEFLTDIQKLAARDYKLALQAALNTEDPASIVWPEIPDDLVELINS